jgi:putative transposase
MFFYFYAVIDLFSRKPVAWKVHAYEGGDEAAALIEQASWRERRVGDKPLVLHADNGATQKEHILKSKLETLGIMSSHSRPGVLDDNAHIKAWYRTCKYSPGYSSKGFANIEHARRWALKFVTWYNGAHLHSGLGDIMPKQRHDSVAEAILLQQQAVYKAACARNPCAGTSAPYLAGCRCGLANSTVPANGLNKCSKSGNIAKSVRSLEQ